jgi:hypothetical protein
VIPLRAVAHARVAASERLRFIPAAYDPPTAFEHVCKSLVWRFARTKGSDGGTDLGPDPMMVIIHSFTTFISASCVPLAFLLGPRPIAQTASNSER